MAEEFLSFLYRENCIICGCAKDGKILCKTCAKTVEFLSPFAHAKYRGVEIYSATIYQNNLRELIHKLKFNHKKGVARVLAEFLYQYITTVLKENSCNINFQNTVLVPIPTNNKNIKQRGYNNVFEITKELSHLLNISFSGKILIKIKDTKPQYKLSKDKRMENVFGCFDIDINEYKKYEEKDIILIDDIYTTGATINEAIRTFQAKGINNIICITLSKAV